MLSLIKQPLVHFLIAGAIIFIAYQFTDRPEPVSAPLDMVIDVERTDLLNFMQYRAQAFQPELFNEQLDNMSNEGLDRLVAAYVREEALYREAVAMGMDQGDYIIRQRLVQKVEFLLENLVNQELESEAGEIQEFYERRREDYQIDAVYTFTHIFFDSEERGWESAQQDAAVLLASPAVSNIGFNDASQYGDRYPFLQNYVERTRDFVVNNFTEDFVVTLDALTANENRWYGPYKSRYGVHLVLLRKRTEPYIPELDQIRARVMDDWRFEIVQEDRQEAEEQVIGDYQINVNL